MSSASVDAARDARKPVVRWGRILYVVWYRPKAVWRHWNKQGWLNSFRVARGRAAMQRAAADLPPLPAPPEDAPTVHFLSGAKFWYQTLFCAYSLSLVSDVPPRFVILDDGTLAASDCGTLKRILPGCVVVSAEAIQMRLDAVLPTKDFPTLRQRRLVYLHLRKLTDVHVLGGGWKLVLDSDMLFHAPPERLLAWLRVPRVPIHMVDVETAYGYSAALMRELTQREIPPRVNVGVCGLDSDMIDWPQLEDWCSRLMAREGSHYLQEQALVAMLLSQAPGEAMTETEGIVCPGRAETQHPTVALHHYVAASKAWYFRFGWRRVATAALRRRLTS